MKTNVAILRNDLCFDACDFFFGIAALRKNGRVVHRETPNTKRMFLSTFSRRTGRKYIGHFHRSIWNFVLRQTEEVRLSLLQRTLRLLGFLVLRKLCSNRIIQF